MKFVLTTLVFLFSLSTYAKNCQYSYKPNDVKITFTGYKLPEKVGVPGTFKKIHIAGARTGSSVQEILERTSYSIELTSVFTKDKGRDVKIAKFFFSPLLSGQSARGYFKNVSGDKLDMVLALNGVEKSVPMTYSVKGESFSATGSIDVLEFGMAESLKALAKACALKHKNKSWSDVGLKIEANFSKKCK